MLTQQNVRNKSWWRHGKHAARVNVWQSGIQLNEIAVYAVPTKEVVSEGQACRIVSYVHQMGYTYTHSKTALSIKRLTTKEIYITATSHGGIIQV